MLLLPPLLPGDRRRIPDPQLVLTIRQQTLKPMRVSAGLDPHHHRPLESLVKSPGFPRMQQRAFDQLARFLLQHCDLLEARMKVTTDILHMRPPSSRALGHKHIEFTRDGLGAVVVIQSSRAYPTNVPRSWVAREKSPRSYRRVP